MSTECQYCGKRIKENAVVCPYCGNENRSGIGLRGVMSDIAKDRASQEEELDRKARSDWAHNGIGLLFWLPLKQPIPAILLAFMSFIFATGSDPFKGQFIENMLYGLLFCIAGALLTFLSVVITNFSEVFRTEDYNKGRHTIMIKSLVTRLVIFTVSIALIVAFST